MKRLIPIIAALMFSVLNANAQTVTGSLTTSSPLSAGTNGGSLSYYCHAYTFQVSVPGNYTIQLTSDFDSWGQLYPDTAFYYQYPEDSLLIYNDDNVDVDFGFTYACTPGSYTVVVSTFNNFETGNYSMAITGPAAVPITDAALIAGPWPTGVPLPLTLIDFTAKKENNRAALQWVTANEDNVNHFEVEKSINGKDYVNIGRVAATSNNAGAETSYTFTDNNLNAGLNAYRLNMVDKNGAAHYSKIATVQDGITATTKATIYPNPTYGKAVLQLTSVAAGMLQLHVLDVSGKAVLQQQYTIAAGGNTLPLNVAGWVPGTYLLQWAISGEHGTLQLQVK
jgi:hypothetical protein